MYGRIHPGYMYNHVHCSRLEWQDCHPSLIQNPCGAQVNNTRGPALVELYTLAVSAVPEQWTGIDDNRCVEAHISSIRWWTALTGDADENPWISEIGLTVSWCTRSYRMKLLSACVANDRLPGRLIIPQGHSKGREKTPLACTSLAPQSVGSWSSYNGARMRRGIGMDDS